MHPTKRKIETVSAGDIAAIVGLKNTTTGIPLSPKISIVLESIKFPESVISVRLNRKAARSGQTWCGLQRLSHEDPTFKTYTDAETGQTIISGMGNFISKLLSTVY
jgi:elongation factor G